MSNIEKKDAPENVPAVEVLAPKKNKGHSTLQILGLHPLAALALTAVDSMLFGANAITGGATLPLSIVVGTILGAGIVLTQKHSYNDTWGTALGKGLLLGILTAIPTPLPSIVTLAMGGGGLMKLLQERKT